MKKVSVGDEGNEMVGGAHPTSLARLGLAGWALPTTPRGNGIPGLFNRPSSQWRHSSLQLQARRECPAYSKA